MFDIFSTSLFTRIFGDTTTEILINAAVLSLLIFIVYKYLVAPVRSLVLDIAEYFKKRELVCIEITPPHKNEIDPDNTKNLVHTLQRIYSKERLSFEITSSKKDGIKYRIVAESHSEANIKKQLTAYMPELKLKVVRLKQENTDVEVFTFRQRRHFAYPLKTYVTNERSDPINYLASSFTKMKQNESVTLQLIVRPYSSNSVSRIYNNLLKDGRTNVGGGIKYYLLAYAWIWVPGVIVWILTKNWALGLISSFLIWVIAFFSDSEPPQPLTSAEENLYGEIIEKLDQPLAKVNMRLSIHSDNPQDVLDDFRSSLKVFERTGFQAIDMSKSLKHSKWQEYLIEQFSGRLSAIVTRNSMILSASELASLYHFPYGDMKVEGMVRSHSRTLPAPLSLKGDPELDVMVGVNKYQDEETLIGLTADERERHMYIIGGTGNGKTTMLKYMITQDIQNNKGVAVVDPHGDLAEELLGLIPEHRIQDVVYINPDDLAYPIGINLLELTEGLSGDELLREKDLITESTISVLRKLFSEDDSGGHRIEYVLRNTIQTALTVPGANLFTIFRLLNDKKYRKDIVNRLEDQDLKIFWKNELGKAGEMQKVKMAAGITAKIGRFLFSASAKRILEQEKSTINFDTLMDEGKIVICNFSKGLLGEDTSMLFGVTVLAKLQLASLRRARLAQENRRPFYVYVDEFQNFATMSFVQMLSEARKYKLYLTMAEQSTQQQQEQRLVDIILANVATVVAFRSGSPADARLLIPLFSPYIEERELANLPAYNFYCRISAIHAQEPLSGVTVLLDSESNVEIAESVRAASRTRYAKQIVEQDKTDEAVESIVASKPRIKRKKVKQSTKRGVPQEELIHG